MTKTVYRTNMALTRIGLTQKETWGGPDLGLIKCWEVGRTRAEENPELAQRCRAGELPVLGWKGGVSRRLKKREKYGTLKYLAQWQGLRGDDLCIDLSKEHTIICSKTGMIVIFTPDQSKYINQITDSEI